MKRCRNLREFLATKKHKKLKISKSSFELLCFLWLDLFNDQVAIDFRVGDDLLFAARPVHFD